MELNTGGKFNSLDEKDDINLSQADRAYHYIRDLILNLKILPGQPLSETDFTEKLDMSRTPIREAFFRLKSDGLVETVGNRGTFVKLLTLNDIRKIYETAEGLEGMIAYLAANRADKNGHKDLLNWVEVMEEALAKKDFKMWVRGDEGFHNTLHNLCNNNYLVNHLNLLYNQIHRVRLMTLKLSYNYMSTKEHRELYEVLKEGNGDLAMRLTHKHWRRVRELVLDVISPMHLSSNLENDQNK